MPDPATGRSARTGDARCVRDGNDLQVRGLYLDEPAWRAQVFSLTKRDDGR